MADVQQNVKVIKSQLDAAERKLDLSEHISEPDVRDEAGSQVMDIREELDDHGNIICEC